MEKRNSAAKDGRSYEPHLGKAIVRAFGFKFALLGIFTVWEECLIRILQPLFMSWFIRYFSSEDSGLTVYHAYGYGIGIVMMAVFYCVTHHQYFFGVMHSGMKLRVAHCALIYRKALRLSKSALADSTVGQMVNLLSNDVNRFDMCTFFVHYLWVGPLQFVIVVWLTYLAIGPAAFVGGALIIAFVPFQSKK